MNVNKELIEKILELKPQDKIFLIEALVESLDKPDKYIQEVWLKEAQDRLNAHRQGGTKGIPAEDVLGEDFLPPSKLPLGKESIEQIDLMD